MGIGAPFGLMTQYEDDWVGRFHSRKFDIRTMNINPSIAFKVNDQLSVGAGVSWQRIDAEYRLAQALPTGLPGGCPQFVQGDAKVKMKDNA